MAYRFYHAWIAAKVLTLNDMRATPAERLNDGHDYEPTHRWIVFGHHFAAIAGPGPLVGPVLAAQFGYLPGALWIIIGAALGGAVHDLIVLAASMRRNGRSIGEMAREEIGRVGGYIAMVTVLLIMIILLAVIALVVVNALRDSPWGTFTIAATMPIAILMGLYLRFWRKGKVLEVSIIGFALVVLAIFGGEWVSKDPALAELVHALRRGAGLLHHHLRLLRQRFAGVAAAGAARLLEHVREARAWHSCWRWASWRSGRKCSCRR